jgi:predicted membrane GTPase involved in stress response
MKSKQLTNIRAAGKDVRAQPFRTASCFLHC